MSERDLAYDLSELTSRYRDDDFVHLPGLISAPHAAQLVATTTEVPVKEVICGTSNVHFGEQKFGDEHAIAQFFARDELTRLVLALTASQHVSQLTCWTSMYRAGQFINPHTDASGSIQLLVCLQAPPADTNGGHLILRAMTAQELRLGLRAGDGVIFKATSVRHHTTPLVSSHGYPDPVRVVAVGRYFTSRHPSHEQRHRRTTAREDSAPTVRSIRRAGPTPRLGT